MLLAAPTWPNTETRAQPPASGLPALRPSEQDIEGVTSQGLQPRPGSRGHLLPWLPVHREARGGLEIRSCKSNSTSAVTKFNEASLDTKRDGRFQALWRGSLSPSRLVMIPSRTGLRCWHGRLSLCFARSTLQPCLAPSDLLLRIKDTLTPLLPKKIQHC